MKSIKCNIIKAGRGDVYGRPFAIGQIYTGPFDYVRQLVSCGYATVDDAAVFDDDSTPQNSEIAIVGKGRMAVEAELNEVTGVIKILMPDGTETDAKIALKDTDLDLVFLKPEKPTSNFKPIPLADTAPMNLLDDVIVIGRMSKELNREPMAATGEIISVIKKPRLFGKISAPATGMPVFNDQGKFLGIGINRLTSKSSGESNVGSTSVLLPAADIADSASQVK